MRADVSGADDTQEGSSTGCRQSTPRQSTGARGEGSFGICRERGKGACRNFRNLGGYSQHNDGRRRNHNKGSIDG